MKTHHKPRDRRQKKLATTKQNKYERKTNTICYQSLHCTKHKIQHSTSLSKPINGLCRDTISARTVVGHSLLLARLPGTHWVTICVIRRWALTVSDTYSKLVRFWSKSTLELLHITTYLIKIQINKKRMQIFVSCIHSSGVRLHPERRPLGICSSRFIPAIYPPCTGADF